MKEEFSHEMEDRWRQFERRRKHGRIWTGLFLLVIGGLLLLKTTHLIFFPVWFFTWPVLLIAIGLFIGLRHNFRGGFWIIPVLIGGLTLIDQANPALDLNRFVAPIILMAIGLLFLLRPRRQHWRKWRQANGGDWSAMQGVPPGPGPGAPGGMADRRDFVDITAIFGGVKKNVLTKNFRGGDIVSFMGGSEIDLTQADFTGRVTLDTTNVFGGTKLIVPPTWDVQSDITAIFGGVDDKRQISGISLDPNKVLVLDGTCLFGGIEIRSFK